MLCNCWQYVKSNFADLPGSREVLNNLSDTGSVAVFYYASVGLNHYAIVLERTATHITISETNYQRCKFGTRTIPLDDPALLGFYPID